MNLIQVLDTYTNLISKHNLDSPTPQLYFGYIIRKLQPAHFYHTISFNEQEIGKLPNSIQKRILKLLLIPIKAHYFLYKNDKLQDLRLFNYIDLGSGKEVLGIIYGLKQNQRHIIVAETDIATISTSKILTGKFPVVIPTKQKKWINLLHWESLEEYASQLREIYEKENSREQESAIKTHIIRETFPYGTLFDVPPELKAQVKNAGLRWAEGVGSWYLPLGYDVHPVTEYIEFIKKTHQDAILMMGRK